MKKAIIISLFLLGSMSLYGQSCPQWPAPCPSDGEISIAHNVAQREELNNVLPQEMAMEGELRNALTDVIRKLASEKHWQWYEVTESAWDRGDNGIDYQKWEATPYEKRPPHEYAIAFVLVVNSDSLQVWHNWYINDFEKKGKEASTNEVSTVQTEDNDKQLQGYMDSANYYLSLRSKYVIDVISQHNKGQDTKAFTDKLAWYKKKSDGFLNEYKNKSAAKNASWTNSFDALHNEGLSKTRLFTNASLILIDFSINRQTTDFGLTDKNQKCILPKKTLAIQNSFYAGVLQNMAKPADNEYRISALGFDYPLYTATVLLGGWLHRYNKYNYILASYTGNPVAHDVASIKKTKCDVVQNIAVKIEGRQDYVQQALKSVDLPAVEKMVAQKF